MPVVEIRITIPEGTPVSIAGVEGATFAATEETDKDPVERYWREYLSHNGRRIYAAAATVEDFSGPNFTLDDIAASRSITYESVRSIHRTTGRSAKKWRRETGTKEPVRLEPTGYDWDAERGGMRTAYRLPEGVAAAVKELAMAPDGIVQPQQVTSTR